MENLAYLRVGAQVAIWSFQAGKFRLHLNYLPRQLSYFW